MRDKYLGVKCYDVLQLNVSGPEMNLYTYSQRSKCGKVVTMDESKWKV